MPGIDKIFCLTAQVEQIVADSLSAIKAKTTHQAEIQQFAYRATVGRHSTPINFDIFTRTKLISPMARGKDWQHPYIRSAYIHNLSDAANNSKYLQCPDSA